VLVLKPFFQTANKEFKVNSSHAISKLLKIVFVIDVTMTCGLDINGKCGILGILYISVTTFSRPNANRSDYFELLDDNIASLLIFSLEDPNSRSPHPTPYCNLH